MWKIVVAYKAAFRVGIPSMDLIVDKSKVYVWLEKRGTLDNKLANIFSGQ